MSIISQLEKQTVILLTEVGIIEQIIYNTKSDLKFKISVELKNKLKINIKNIGLLIHSLISDKSYWKFKC